MAKSRTQKERQEEITKLTNKMNEAIINYKKNPEDQIELLDYMTKFRNYSFHNQALIQSQYEGAQGVGSFKSFKEKGFYVRRGQKSIKVLAPVFGNYYLDNDLKSYKAVKYANKEAKEKIKTGEFKVEKLLDGYRLVNVFDVTQTNAKPEDYPTLYPNKPENYFFEGTNDDLEDIYNALESYADYKNIKIITAEFNSAAKGMYIPSSNEILLSERLSKKEKLATLTHELAHSEMHNNEKSKLKKTVFNSAPVREYQAQMSSYVVTNYLGLDTKENTERYINSWIKNSEIKLDDITNEDYISMLEEVKQVSLNMSDDISSRFISLKNERTAKNLQFLQNDDYNYYEKYKNKDLKCVSLYTKRKSDYQIHMVELKADDGKKFIQPFVTSSFSDKDLKIWKTGMTGEKWLNKNLLKKISEENPNFNFKKVSEEANAGSREPIDKLLDERQKEKTQSI